MAGQDSGIKSDENGMANMFDDGMHNINSAKAGIGNTYTGDKTKVAMKKYLSGSFGLFALNFIPFIGTLLFNNAYFLVSRQIFRKRQGEILEGNASVCSNNDCSNCHRNGNNDEYS